VPDPVVASERSLPLRLAHRGDWRNAPENSLAAMEAALRVPGCDGLEFDVRASSDGVPILLHDATLRRVQGLDVSPSTLTAEECAELGLSSLAEVLHRVGGDPYLDVELKELVPAVIDLLEVHRGGVTDDGRPTLRDAVVSSFDVEILRWLARERPTWPRWLNAEDLLPSTIELAVNLGCEAISTNWRHVDEPALAEANAAGIQVGVYTVRTRADYDRLAGLELFAICVEGAALDP
jgi:glycerophosphoryl diester phosphodiesterase